MNFLGCIQFLLLSVVLSAEAEERLGPIETLRPLKLTYINGKVDIEPYKNLTNKDIKDSEVSYAKLRTLWSDNINNVDPIQKDEINLNISFCQTLEDTLHLKKAVITNLKTTNILPVVLRSYETWFMKRLDINITIPKVELYSYYQEDLLRANGSFIFTLKDITAELALKLESPLYREGKRGNNNFPVPFVITGFEARAQVPTVQFQLSTNPRNDFIESNLELIQLGIDVSTESVKEALGDYILTILKRYINDILPS